MTTTTHKPVTCKNPECKIKFTPQVNYNNLIVSGYCPECRYSREMAKRRIQADKMNHREPISDKTALKSKLSVVRKSRTTGKKAKRTRIEDKPIDELLDVLDLEFNRNIRNRDRLHGDYFYCPTCQQTKKIDGDNYQACHVFPAGPYPALRFLEINVHGGCKSCNYFKHGAGHEYNDWLRKKIGEVEYQKLLDLKDYWKAHQWHWDRFGLIRLIEVYKAKNKAFGKPEKENILEGNNF